jgi:GMP synthase-like glutamine amidotransferase
LIVEHVEGEGPRLLLPSLDAEICRVWRGEPLPEKVRHDALIVMGGSNAAWDEAVQHEVGLISAYLAAQRPVLGVCLGSQLVARALGGRNFRGPAPEKGVVKLQLTDEGRRDPLLGHLDGAEVVAYHEDTFELPPGAVRLASTAAYANQAFRAGNAWGVQFHIECDQELRRSWEMAAGSDEPGVRFAEAFAKLVFSSLER